MKLRIVSDKIGFKVQRRKFGLWSDVEVPFGPNASLPKHFKTDAQARTWVKENYPDAEIAD